MKERFSTFLRKRQDGRSPHGKGMARTCPFFPGAFHCEANTENSRCVAGNRSVATRTHSLLHGNTSPYSAGGDSLALHQERECIEPRVFHHLRAVEKYGVDTDFAAGAHAESRGLQDAI